MPIMTSGVAIAFFRSAALTAVTISLSGCGLLGRCNHEQRHVVAEGNVSEGGVEIAWAQITVGATRGGLQWRDVHWYVKAPHEGRVTAMRLVPSTQPVPILLELPVNEPIVPFEYVSALVQRKDESTPALGGIFEIVAAGGAALEITTDVQTRPLIRIPLAVTSFQDWYRDNNCY